MRYIGHFVPSQGKWRAFFSAYLRDPGPDIPSPGATVDVAY
jgi:hypothetical protein